MAIPSRPVSSARPLFRLVVVGLLAWGLLIAGWWMTVAERRFVDVRVLLALPVVAIVVTVATALWVRHNQAIYRRKGPRRSVPSGAYDWRYDQLGRLALVDPDRLRGARVINVSVQGSFKSFDAVD